MAAKITAIAAYKPRIQLEKGAGFKEVVKLIARQTRMKEAKVIYVLKEFCDAVAIIAKQGRGIRIKGFATYRPTIKPNGMLTFNIKAEAALVYQLNTGGAFKGKIINRDMIGKTPAQLMARWNSERPYDPVEE